jgi:hypothetical protein
LQIEDTPEDDKVIMVSKDTGGRWNLFS